MSDINISGIPNMGFAGGGGGYLGGNAATGTPAMSSAQIMASLYGNYSPGAAQSTLNNIYGAGGFGAQPAYYAALGAAYGRQVAPSSPAAVAAARTPGYSYNDAAGLPQSPAPYYQDPNVAPTGYNPFDSTTYQLWQPQTYAPAQPAANPYAQMYRMPEANPSYFNPATYAGAGGNYGIPYNGRPMAGDIGFSKQPSYPNLGYNSSFSSLYAQPAYNNNFAARFGQWGMGAGTPSQYYSPAQQPGSFSQPYSIDQPGGALPLQPGIYQNSPFGTNSQAGG